VDQLGRVLSLLGVGEREAEIYVALVEQGPKSARELAEALGIPYTKIYTYLYKLENLGVVAKEGGGRPYKYRARPPAEVYKMLVNKTSEALRQLKPYIDGLQMVYERRHAVASTFLTLVRGTERIAELIHEIITTADSEVYLALSFPELVTYRLVSAIEEESKRVSIKVLTTARLRPMLSLPPRVEVRTTAELFGGGAIGDAVVIYVKHLDELSGVYSNERYIIEVAKTYFNHVWQRASFNTRTEQHSS